MALVEIGDGPAESIVLFAILIVTLTYFYARRFLNNQDDNELLHTGDTSLIMTMYTLGVGIQSVSRGTVGTLPYNLLITTDIPRISLPAGKSAAPSGQIIMNITLPWASQVHIAGISTSDNTVQQLLGNTSLDNRMTQVRLEGDFPEHFHLYCSPEKEIELLQVLDPARMAFLIDFCRYFIWELYGNNLYFVQPEKTQADDVPMTMAEAAEKFAHEILPTLKRMSDDE
jgi:hypothetical protein